LLRVAVKEDFRLQEEKIFILYTGSGQLKICFHISQIMIGGGKKIYYERKKSNFSNKQQIKQILVMVSVQRANNLRRPVPTAAALIVVSLEGVAGFVSIHSNVYSVLCYHIS
jgi:hypothetical protein